MNLQVPTRVLQDRAIAGIVNFLRTYHDPIDERRDKSEAIHSLMLKHGRAWYIGERTFAGRRAGRKHCYRNAYALADRDPRMTYVEDWCHTGKFSFCEHAWCIDPAGQVIDPTLHEAAGYFGIPLRMKFVRSTISKTNVYGVLGCDNSDLLTALVETFLDDTARRDATWRG